MELIVHEEFTWLAEYYDMQLGKRLENGTIAAKMQVGSVDWIVRFALGNADRLRVIAPESIVNLIAERGNAALKGYT